jgi:D-alanyl-D-alanine carboxypeptidase
MSNDTPPTYDSFLRITPLLVGGLILACCAILMATLILSKTAAHTVSPQTATSTQLSSAFDSLHLEAQAVYVYDAKTKSALFERDAYEPLPLASITKLLSVIVAQNVFLPGTIITISPEALATEGDSGLFVGERWILRDLLRYIVTVSSNDGASALARTYNEQNTSTFVEKLNEYSKTLGLSSFSFVNATGLDTQNTGKAANFGSARDVALLFAHALTNIPDILDATRTGEGSIASLDKVHLVSNTNIIIDEVSNAVGSKTGFTDAAGGNLVLSFDVGIGHPIIIAVLGSSKEGRFTDVQKLVTATRVYFEEKE